MEEDDCSHISIVSDSSLEEKETMEASKSDSSSKAKPVDLLIVDAEEESDATAQDGKPSPDDLQVESEEEEKQSCRSGRDKKPPALFQPSLKSGKRQPRRKTFASRSTTVANTRQASQPRRSGREKRSTVVNVGGYAVRRENNYSVRGGEYVFGQAQEMEKAPRKVPTIKKKAPQTEKQRTLSVADEKRRGRNAAVATAKNDKAASRHAFLSERIETLAPFLEPKVHKAFSSKALPPDRTPVEQPKAIEATLRSYQVEGLEFMSYMYSINVGMILGDEMGLGKTLQTISLVAHIKEQYGCTGPSLIVCPLSVLYSWCNEITKWAPSLKFIKVHCSSTNVNVTAEEIQDCDMVVTTYETVKIQRVCQLIWQRVHFNLCVLDEGHAIKNHESLVSQYVRKIHCEQKIILTGTPLANNLGELWSLLNYLCPDVFTIREPFAEAFDLILNVVDPVKLGQAHKILKIFMIRRLKVEVEKLLPKKMETKVFCPLSSTQIWWYKALLMKDMSLLTAEGASSGTRSAKLANLLMQLRKCCIHPFLFPEAEDIDSTTLTELVGSSGKLAVLDKLLCSLYKKGHRVVLFSQFTSALDILHDYCDMRGWDFCRLDGSTSRARRNYVVNSFTAPNSSKFIFLMSTRSGGMGLNLQTADTCILLDSDWNPQPDIQAMARVHRIGQTKTVHVYRLVTEGTVEQRMVERAEKKLYLDRVVTRDGADDTTGMNEDEDSEKLLSTLKFGCNAVFGKGSKENPLPSNEDIAIITDRARTVDFSSGKLEGGAEEAASGFNATKELSETTTFAGIDFKKLREEKMRAGLKDMRSLHTMWKEKRARKNRIKLLDGTNSGYGSKAVPVLAINDYDLETGERSVFNQELQGRADCIAEKKKGPSFIALSYCIVCGDGGDMICCPRCPVSLHLSCSGVQLAKYFAMCSHHHCSICSKPASMVGGMLFPCNACPNSFCEDHLPEDAKFLDPCDRMEVSCNFTFKNGVYIHCSKQCEEFASSEYNYVCREIATKRPCPESLDLTDQFGKVVDDSMEAPTDVNVIAGKRKREAPVRLGLPPPTKAETKAAVQPPKKKAAVKPPQQKEPSILHAQQSQIASQGQGWTHWVSSLNPFRSSLGATVNPPQSKPTDQNHNGPSNHPSVTSHKSSRQPQTTVSTSTKLSSVAGAESVLVNHTQASQSVQRQTNGHRDTTPFGTKEYMNKGPGPLPGDNHSLKTSLSSKENAQSSKPNGSHPSDSFTSINFSV